MVAENPRLILEIKKMNLYRPIGLHELTLIAASDFSAYPPRLPEQPIFYPVLNIEYAEHIAHDWNAKTPPYAGFVTRFELEQVYAEGFEIHTVGGRIHQELWVPAAELTELNRHILGKIEIIAAYYGKNFTGSIASRSNLPGGMSSQINHL
jgi:hypothetical protein